jgi:hypothetical protein
VSQGLQGAVEAKFVLMEVAFQSADKLTAKNLSEHGDGEKEARARWNPHQSAFSPLFLGEIRFGSWLR